MVDPIRTLSVENNMHSIWLQNEVTQIEHGNKDEKKILKVNENELIKVMNYYVIWSIYRIVMKIHKRCELIHMTGHHT